MEEKKVTQAETLEDFLLNSSLDMKEEVKISDRIPFKFKIHAMDSELFTTLQKKHTKVQRKGKTDFDSIGFSVSLIIECCEYPNFKSSEFVKKLGVMTPVDAVKKVLLPGEIVNLSNFIQDLSGFDKDTDDLKEEVKNF